MRDIKKLAIINEKLGKGEATMEELNWFQANSHRILSNQDWASEVYIRTDTVPILCLPMASFIGPLVMFIGPLVMSIISLLSILNFIDITLYIPDFNFNSYFPLWVLSLFVLLPYIQLLLDARKVLKLVRLVIFVKNNITNLIKIYNIKNNVVTFMFVAFMFIAIILGVVLLY
jgi:hypothetical protein